MHLASTGGGPLRKLGRRLQLPRTIARLDHVLSFASFWYAAPYCNCAPAAPIATNPVHLFDKELLMGRVMSCKGRREFLAELEARLGHFNETIAPPLLELPTPDRYFEELDKIAIEVGCNHHGRQNRFNAFDSC